MRGLEIVREHFSAIARLFEKYPEKVVLVNIEFDKDGDGELDGYIFEGEICKIFARSLTPLEQETFEQALTAAKAWSRTQGEGRVLVYRVTFLDEGYSEFAVLSFTKDGDVEPIPTLNAPGGDA